MPIFNLIEDNIIFLPALVRLKNIFRSFLDKRAMSINKNLNK